MKKVYRAHPLMILRFIKPFLFILILPVVKAVLQYLIDGKIEDVLGLEMLVFFAVVIFAGLRCLSFRLECCEDSVTIRTGFLFKRMAEIKIAKLSSVKTVQNPLDYIFKAVNYQINTEAGALGRPDFQFKLSIRDSREVSELLYGAKAHTMHSFSAVKVAVMAAATSSAFTGMLIGVPIINRAGKLLGLGLSEMLFNEINNVSSKIESYFPPIVNTVTLIFLLAYGVSFLYSFLKFINFKVFFGQDKFEVRSGLLTRTRTSFKKKSVNNVLIVQSPIMRIIKRYAMKVSVGGFGEAKSESQVMVPSGRYREIMNGFSLYFPFLTPLGRTVFTNRTRQIRDRFLFLPALYLLLVIAASVVLAILFTDFGRLILFLSIVALCIVFYYAYICIFEYNNGKIMFGENIFAKSARWLRTCELYCPKEKVGQIKITRFLLDMRQNTCRIRITVCSESADSIRVRHLDYPTVIKEVYREYNLYE